MTRRAVFSCSFIIILFLSGCQGTGKVVNFDLEALPANTKQLEAYHDDSLIIAVDDFKDVRPEKKRIGTRTHFWGGVTHFNAWNGDIGSGMANLGLEYLKQRQWNAMRTTPGNAASPSNPDVTLTGRVLTFETRAKSGFGFTKIDVVLKVGFEAANAVDGSSVRMVLGSNGTDTVVFFDPDDIRDLTNHVAKELFDQLFRDLTVTDRAFRLKSQQP